MKSLPSQTGQIFMGCRERKGATRHEVAQVRTGTANRIASRAKQPREKPDENAPGNEPPPTADINIATSS